MEKRNICGCNMSQNMEKRNNCGCDMSQVRNIVKLLFTTLLSNGVFDCGCMSHNRRSEKKRKKKRKKKSGGAGSRQRRSARRAETARGTSTSSPVTTSDQAPPTASIPPPPPRTTSLIQDVCGMIDKPPPELPPKLSDEEKEWQSEIKKQIKQLSDAKEVEKLLKLKERAREVGQHEQERKTLDPGQATGRKTVDQGQATKMQKPPVSIFL